MTPVLIGEQVAITAMAAASGSRSTNPDTLALAWNRGLELFVKDVPFTLTFACSGSGQTLTGTTGRTLSWWPRGRQPLRRSGKGCPRCWSHSGRLA